MYDTLIIKTAGLEKEHKKMFIEKAKEFERFCNIRVSRYPGFLVIESISFSPGEMLNAFEKLRVPFWSKAQYEIMPSRNVWAVFCEISGQWTRVVDRTVTDIYDQEFEDEVLWYPQCKNSQTLADSVW